MLEKGIQEVTVSHTEIQNITRIVQGELIKDAIDWKQIGPGL